MRSLRFQIIWAGVRSACALVAFSAVAVAQSRPADIECRTTETQAECHARLKCKPGEDLEDCQKRLGAAKSGNAGQRDDADPQRSDRGDRDRDRSDRDRSDRSDRDRDRSDRDRDRSDRDRSDRSDRDRDRSNRRNRDDRARSRRERGNRRAGGGGSKDFEANKTFGLGLELGAPTGLNGKYFLSESGALDFGVGWIYRHYYYGDGLHLYADYLWHPVSLVSAPAFELPFYLGVGLRFWEFDYCEGRVCTFDGSAIGIRVPFGIAVDFNNVPLDIFIQLVPVIDFVRGDYYDRDRDRAHFGIDLSAGIRFWFN